MFFGHTHRDTFQVFYENGTLNDPIQVAYVAPSGTVFSQYWPSYRIYTIDGNYEGSSFRVLDHETYMLNLTDANASDKPKWELEYKAKVCLDHAVSGASSHSSKLAGCLQYGLATP